MDDLIVIHNLRKVYHMGQTVVHALAGVDLRIRKGDFLAVLGPSGSGKSTLLHLLGGLDRPTSGSIEVAGQRLEQMDENLLATFRRKQVGFIFQAFNLIPNMTAQDNVAFPLLFNGTSRKQRDLLAYKLLERVGLEARVHHRPFELSGGEQQRVAVARALINDPELILADEPTGNLDTYTGAQILQLLASLHQQGRTVAVVSHDPRVTHYASETVFLLDGRSMTEEEYNAALALAAMENSNHEKDTGNFTD